MGEHNYTNPGAAPKVELVKGDHVPLTSVIYLRDGADVLRLAFNDLDTLRGVRHAFNDALTLMIAKLLDDTGETVSVRQLESGDEAFIDGDLVTVDTIVIDTARARVSVRHLDHDGAPHTTIFPYDAQVQRLMVPTLTAVR